MLLRALLWTGLVTSVVTGADEVRSITAVTGDDCVLPCSKVTSLELSLLEWTHSDQDKRLLVFRGRRVLQGYEHSRYRHRVKLVDPQLQSGDFSVVLKNVTLEDTGTYRCLAVYEDLEIQEKQEVSQFIHLTVTKPAESSAHVSVVISLIGEDQELTCQTEVSEGAEVLVLEWTRKDLDRHVLLFRDNRTLHKNQHPRYKNRVELRDKDLSSGILTILMKNVSTEDHGLYKCEALIQTSDRRKNHQQSFHLKPAKPIVAESGEDQELPCASPPGGAAVVDLLWTREGSDAPVLHRDGRLREEHQNHALKGRVELLDPELRSDLSIVLRNISTNDSGLYTCHAQTLTSDGRRQDHTQFIYLTVKPGTKSSTGGTDHLINIVLAVALTVVVAIFIFAVVWYKNKEKCQPPATKPNEDREEESDDDPQPQSATALTRSRSFTLADMTYRSLSTKGSDELQPLTEPPEPK